MTLHIMWGSRGDSRLGDWSDFVFKSKSSDVCLLKYPVETAAEFQLCWYLARLKQSNVQRDTLQEQWHTRSTPVPVDMNCTASCSNMTSMSKAFQTKWQCMAMQFIKSNPSLGDITWQKLRRCLETSRFITICLRSHVWQSLRSSLVVFTAP